MNGKKTWVALLAAVNLIGFDAFANQIPGELVTGTVTSVSGQDWIKVDGHSYHIQSGSAAAAALQGLAPGQRVDVQLNGPANTAASEVINIVPHAGR
ncbi:MAG TPA: hypothetical protein VIY54_10850 [Steroidobacteraceae bacterium]